MTRAAVESVFSTYIRELESAFESEKLYHKSQVVPILIFPPEATLILSILFVLRTRSCRFVLPMKSFAPITFPENPHPVPVVTFAHLAFPDASEVRTYPFDAPESILSPWNDQVPATVSLSLSPDDCQIPMFPLFP